MVTFYILQMITHEEASIMNYIASVFSVMFFMSVSLVATAQPETLLNPARALQGYTGESYCSVPMSELDFEAFFAQVKSLPNDRLRFEKIRTEVHAMCLATPYVFRMIELIENSGFEYDMMRLCFYYCVDPENFDRLLPYMQGGTYREAMSIFLRERVNSQRAEVEGQRQLMNTSEMDRAMAILRNLDSDQSKLAVATEIISGNNLLSEQIREIMNQLNLTGNKKELAQRAYPLVYDPANFFLVYERLPRRDRQKIMAEIEANKRPDEPTYTSSREIGCTYRVAESEFVGHLNSLKAQQREDLKLRLAQQLFENNCFNVSELRRAMNLFESDIDRLELVKVAQAYVFDPWNIYMVNAEFRRASSIDALYLYLESL